MGARGSPAHQQEAGTLKIDDPDGWLGRGGRIVVSSASPHKVGSHTNKGTVKGSSKGARGSPAHQQMAGTLSGKRQVVVGRRRKQSHASPHKAGATMPSPSLTGRTTVRRSDIRGIDLQVHRHKVGHPDGWLGRGGRISGSSASPRKIGSHTNKGTLKGPSKGARGSPAHQQMAGTL